MEFTKEQLIEWAQKHKKRAGEYLASVPNSEYGQKDLRLAEIALAALNAPDNIPPHVLDAMSDMCDGGFNGQGIWNLCLESIMPPAPCPRCGTVSERPDGGHYCHPAAVDVEGA